MKREILSTHTFNRANGVPWYCIILFSLYTQASNYLIHVLSLREINGNHSSCVTYSVVTAFRVSTIVVLSCAPPITHTFGLFTVYLPVFWFAVGFICVFRTTLGRKLYRHSVTSIEMRTFRAQPEKKWVLLASSVGFRI